MVKHPEQMGFNTDETLKWNSEWQDMPEYKQEDKMAYQSIKVNFTCQEDVLKFAKLVGQTLTSRTSYIWFPKQEVIHASKMRYISES